MTKRLAIKTIFIFTIFLSLSLKAEKENLQCNEPLYIIYINGVFNNKTDANDSLVALRKKLSSVKYAQLGFKTANKHFVLMYNESFGLLDLFEVFLQKRNELDKHFLDFLNKSNSWPKWFQDIYRQRVLSSFQPGKYEMSQLQNLINEIIIVSGGKALIVAHSQGNFFANEAVYSTRNSLLIHWQNDQQKVRLVSVATPAAKVEGDGSYTTLTTDGVIGAIPTALPRNTSNNSPKPGQFDHEFIKHYLNGDSSGAKIVYQVENELNKLSAIGKSDEDITCQKWFRANSKNLDKNDNCSLKCNAFSVGMGTLNCHAQCANLCNCLSQ